MLITMLFSKVIFYQKKMFNQRLQYLISKIAKLSGDSEEIMILEFKLDQPVGRAVTRSSLEQ